MTSGFPDASTTVIVEPCFFDTPAFGLCDTTSPVPMLIEGTGLPSFNVIWTLSAAVRACASDRLVNAGVGWEGVNTLVAKTVTRPATRMTASATAPPIHHFL